MEMPARTHFRQRPLKNWLLILCCFLYFGFCSIIYSIAVQPMYGAFHEPFIEADSSNYFSMAGLDTDRGAATDNLIAFGGSSIGPVTIALIFRNQFGVACFNCVLFLVVIWWAGMIPGVRREYFAALMVIEPQLVPSLLTLNKEIMGIAGLVAFAVYLYGGSDGGKATRSRRGSKLFLFAAIVLSVFARWEQILIPMWYFAIESRISPFRGKPRRAVVALLILLSIAWFAAVHIVHLNLAGFLAAVSGGTIARLYAIQERGGFFLVAAPKILMNLAGRWVTPGYFLGDYWTEDFAGNWQNAYIGELSSLVMTCVVGYTVSIGRFRLRRPLIHLTMIYFICTAVNPFVQHRYIYPAYALLSLELARRKEDTEPAVPLWNSPPALPPSYRAVQAGMSSSSE